VSLRCNVIYYFNLKGETLYEQYYLYCRCSRYCHSDFVVLGSTLRRRSQMVLARSRMWIRIRIERRCAPCKFSSTPGVGDDELWSSFWAFPSFHLPSPGESLPLSWLYLNRPERLSVSKGPSAIAGIILRGRRNTPASEAAGVTVL